MRITLSKSREQTAAERKRLYLQAWPIDKQMEAHAEAAQGRPEKQNTMLAAFDAIRTELPYP